ncbi:tRNA nucleotidyltransferase [Legionella geestiana]|uniref:Multifunctional CCA protein n=1 Tax=Legionella geestiana TaxID=45065 RepID=A0A0W0TLS9_9GAMM|nr:multifunctional CCA addition/repair protein [Legionella geestiana]KTC96456.1 tRNA nucleotidyltransferase [Legionella geestiana]QBS12500.1 multifunctional CCA addition/repair protein [Legionella geestiana]QDQ39787.1 multifunctional CCA addition/repair protein [Legionella geestiana]STX55057.1 tRNA nucleotidyltransferase [Legionella geestiana]
MKVFLVGGAVRDALLGLTVKERDWVVVGARPEDLTRLGYRQVGRDFPVFLHPETQEEYALARRERKVGHGYHGFQCEFGTEVTLDEDLVRRDLTINAMARDDKGRLIDPSGGREDLERRLLRHVSPAFVEDPVRVLRLARFAARFAPLGFTLAPETRSLVLAMVKNGELDYLVPERVWQECQKALTEAAPEVFFETLRACGALAVLFPELHALFGVPSPPRWHPEIDTGVHTLQVLQTAARLSDSPLVRFAALLHDLGKAETRPARWPHHYGHEEAGVQRIESLCERLRIPNDYRTLAVLVARFHGTFHRLFELRPETIARLLLQTDAYRRPERFKAFLTACTADALRAEASTSPVASAWEAVWQAARSARADRRGLTGDAIGEAVARARLLAITECLKQWKNDEKQHESDLD